MFRPISEQYGLTHMQMRILMELWSAEDSPTIGQLGRTLGMTSGNMSSMCKRLEQEGFLLRVRDLQDERMVKIALSEKGRDTVRAIEPPCRRKICLLLREAWTGTDGASCRKFA